MKYLFILGRNPQLSVLELKSYFRRIGNKVLDLSQKENSLLVELENTLDADTVDFLGGTIAIGIVICRVKEIDRKEIYLGEKNNFNYALWDYSDSTDEISQYLKKRFRSEKLKASEKKLRMDLSSQDSEKMQILTSKSVDEEYFVYDDLFGKIVQRCDYKKIEERDMNKPVRRESLSISPRLAKIMINLSEVKEGEKLLDAFCGIGVILSEALNHGIKVIGIDKDEKAIKGCRENLKWFGFAPRDFELIKGDSSNTRFNLVDVMVSEPDFGETLKKLPSEDRAKEMIRRYDNIMTGVLNNVKKHIIGRIVITSPYIKIISKKRIGVDLKKLADKTGLKVVEGFPIPEFRENQVVGRHIVVFSKS